MLPLPPAFVVAADPARLAQFREAWRAVGLPDCAAAFAAALRPNPATVAG